MSIVSTSPASPPPPSPTAPPATCQRQLFTQVEIASKTTARLGLYLVDCSPSAPPPPRGGSTPSSPSRRWSWIADQASRTAAEGTLRRIVTNRALHFISAAAHEQACPIPNPYPVKEIVAHARFGSRLAYHRHGYSNYVWTLLTGDHPVDPIISQEPYCIPLAVLLCPTSPALDRLVCASLLNERTVSVIRFVLANMCDTDFASTSSSRSLLGGCLHALLAMSKPALAHWNPNVKYDSHSHLAGIDDDDSAASVAPLAYPKLTNILPFPSRQRGLWIPPERRLSKRRCFVDLGSYSPIEAVLAPNTLFGPRMNAILGPETGEDMFDDVANGGRALHEAGQAAFALSAGTSVTTDVLSRATSTSSHGSPKAPLVGTRDSMTRTPKQGKQGTTSDSIQSPGTAVGRADHPRARKVPLHQVTTPESLGDQEQFGQRTMLIVEERSIAKRADIDRILESWCDTKSGTRTLVWRRRSGRRREALLEDLGCLPIKTDMYKVMRIDQWGRSYTFTLRNPEGQHVKLAGEAAYVALHDRFSAFYANSIPPGGQTKLCPIDLWTDDLSDTPLGSSYSPPAFIVSQDWLHRFHERAKSIGLDLPRFGRILSFTSAGYQVGIHTVPAGGTAWYYLLSGQRNFNFAPPKKILHFQLLAKSVGGAASPRSQTASPIDLGVADIQSIKLRRGEALLAPGCWPHAIITHEPSVMLSSVMYHDYQIPQQIEMWTLERAHGAPDHLRHFEILNYWAMSDLHRRWSIHPQESIEPVFFTQFEALSHAEAAPLSPPLAPRQTALDQGRDKEDPVPLPPVRDLECLIDFVEQHAEHIAVHSRGTLTIENVLQESMAFRRALDGRRSASADPSG